MTTAVILDLDGTVIDSSGIQALRDARRWKDCARQAHQTTVFPGVLELLRTLTAREIKLGLCTSAVSYYAHSMLQHHGIAIFQAVICYHDAAATKPHSAPIVATLAKLQMPATHVLGVGDRVEDVQAYRAAGVYAIGAGWNPAFDRTAGWDEIAATPTDVARIAAHRSTILS